MTEPLKVGDRLSFLADSLPMGSFTVDALPQYLWCRWGWLKELVSGVGWGWISGDFWGDWLGLVGKIVLYKLYTFFVWLRFQSGIAFAFGQGTRDTKLFCSLKLFLVWKCSTCEKKSDSRAFL